MSVTAAKGFAAIGVHCGIRKNGESRTCIGSLRSRRSTLSPSAEIRVQSRAIASDIASPIGAHTSPKTSARSTNISAGAA